MAHGGRIVIIDSVATENCFFPCAGTHLGSKVAVLTMAQIWVIDLASRNILVNVIQPDPIETDANLADGPFADVINVTGSIGL